MAASDLSESVDSSDEMLGNVTQLTSEEEKDIYENHKIDGKTYTQKRFDDAKQLLEREKPRHEIRRSTIMGID